jgi:hypothetical protein
VGGAERREFVRLKTRLTAFFKNPETGKAWRVLTRDISATGLRYSSQDFMEPGTITCKAVVVWSEMASGLAAANEPFMVETGVRFIEMVPATQTLLAQYVKLNT